MDGPAPTFAIYPLLTKSVSVLSTVTLLMSGHSSIISFFVILPTLLSITALILSGLERLWYFKCSVGWHEDKNSYEPFVKYYLGIMLKAYNEFENRVEHLKYHNLSKPDRITGRKRRTCFLSKLKAKQVIYLKIIFQIRT